MMKTCQNCGWENPDSGKFCRYCGTELRQSKVILSNSNQKPEQPEPKLELKPEPPAKNSSRKKLIFAVIAALAVVSVGVSVFFVSSSSAGPGYQETIETAEKYLYSLDYEKAEEYYLEAKEIDPKQSEPYEQLYRIYTIQEEPAKAKEIHSEAMANLEPEEQTHFESIAAVIDEDERPDPERPTVVELGKLDLAPISLDKQAWLLVKDGQYSFLKPDGTIQDASASKQIYLYGKNESGGNSIVYMACLPTDNLGETKMYSDGEYAGAAACGGGGPVTNFPYVLDDSLELTYTSSAKSFVDSMQDGDAYFRLTDPIAVSHQEGAKGEYYIYNTADSHLYGPYGSSESAGFSKVLEQIPGTYPFSQKISSPFWVRSGKEDQNSEGIQNLYTVYSITGTKSLDGFSNAMAIDPFSIGAYKSNRFYLLDENLETLYNGLYEAGAYPISGMAPVKTDGTWKLISLDSSYTEAVSPKKEEPKEEPKEPDLPFKNLTGQFGIHGHRWSGVLDIEADGRVHGSGHVFYQNDTGDGYPNGTGYETLYEAQLVPVSFDASGTPDRFRLTNVQYLEEPGTERIVDGTKYSYSPASDYGGYEDVDYVVYPPGTSYADLPSGSLQWLRKSVSDGVTENYVFVVNGDQAYSKIIEP